MKELVPFPSLSAQRKFLIATLILSFFSKARTTATITVLPRGGYYEEGATVTGTCTYVTDEMNGTDSSKALVTWSSTHALPFPLQDAGKTTWNGTHHNSVRTLTLRANLKLNCNDFWCGTAFPSDSANAFFVVKSVRTPQKAVATYYPEIKTLVCETTKTTSSPPRIFWKDESGTVLLENINETMTIDENERCELNKTYLVASAIVIDEQMEKRSKLYCEVVFHFENIYKNISSRDVSDSKRCIEKTPIITGNPIVLDGGTVTLGCTVDLPSESEKISFPLQWMRSEGLPKDFKFQESQNYSMQPTMTIYKLQATFKADAADNGTIVTCYVNEPNYCGNESVELLIKKYETDRDILSTRLVRDALYQTGTLDSLVSVIMTGPDLVNASQTYSWECVSTGSGQVAPQHLWRDSTSKLLIHVDELPVEKENLDNPSFFTVRSRLSMAIPPKSDSYSISCQVIEQGYFESKNEAFRLITVQFPPQVIRPGGSIQLMTSLNEPVILPCRIMSNPPITAVSWSKDGQLLNLNPTRYGGSTLDSPSLIIKRSRFNDSGLYGCLASNILGPSPDSDPITLIIGSMPQVEYAKLEYKCDQSNRVILPCPAHAMPNVSEVTWRKVVNETSVILDLDGDPRYSGLDVARHKYDLHITEPEPGEYFCVARNSFGAIHGDRLTVQCMAYSQPVMLKDVVSQIVAIGAVVAATCLCVGLLIGYACCGSKK